MKKLFTTVMVFGLVLAVAGLARANSPAFTLESGFNYLDNENDQTVGWKFTVNTNLVVTDLGMWSGAGLSGSHEVGIWEGSALLVSGIVGSGASGAHQDLNFLYVPVTPTSLLSGHTYVIGAHYFWHAGSWIDKATATWNSAVSPVFYLNGGLYAYGWDKPSAGYVSDAFGLIGPNFEVRPVPIPAAVWLFGPGLVGLTALKRRFKE
jgi:hypothetical protein